VADAAAALACRAALELLHAAAPAATAARTAVTAIRRTICGRAGAITALAFLTAGPLPGATPQHR
jgi:hypothetical protein